MTSMNLIYSYVPYIIIILKINSVETLIGRERSETEHGCSSENILFNLYKYFSMNDMKWVFKSHTLWIWQSILNGKHIKIWTKLENFWLNKTFYVFLLCQFMCAMNMNLNMFYYYRLNTSPGRGSNLCGDFLPGTWKKNQPLICWKYQDETWLNFTLPTSSVFPPEGE